MSRWWTLAWRGKYTPTCTKQKQQQHRSSIPTAGCWRAARVGCRARWSLVEEEGCCERMGCERMGRSRRDSFRTHAARNLLDLGCARWSRWGASDWRGRGEVVCRTGADQRYFGIYRFGPCRFVLFCFYCWTASGTVDGPDPRRKRGSEQHRSGSGSGRGDAMLDPVSQQPYRVFLSRRQGQPSLLSSPRLTPFLASVTVRTRRSTIRPQRPVSLPPALILLAAAAG